jgi:thiamine-phosphate pyrophosphorylase
LFSSAAVFERTFPDKRPLFYYITDRTGLAGIQLPECIRRVARWGADFIQIREKDLSDKEVFDLARGAVRSVRGTSCRILVNGRADVALAAGTSGVHLPSDAPDVEALRRWVPPGFLIGVSAHSPRDVLRAAERGADYVLLGPIYATESKRRYGAPLGLGTLRTACRRVNMPVFALGGIRPGCIPALLDAGAAGIAGISIFQRNIDFSARKKENRLVFR